MSVFKHTKKDGTLVDDRFKQIIVMKYLNFIYLYFNHSYILNYLYKSKNYFCFLKCQDEFEQLLSQPEGMSSSSPTASTAFASSIASTLVDDIYAQVMGRERHGRVRGYEFDVTPTLVFGSSSSTGQS